MKRNIQTKYHDCKKAWLAVMLAAAIVCGFTFSFPGTNQSAFAEAESEAAPHRADMYGISDADIDSVDATFNVSNVRNDVTGNWRISTIATNIDIEKYALSYYQKYFTSDSEIHAIVNFANGTTTRITCMMSSILDVTILEYVDGEEHDAKALFGGDVLKEFFVYLDNGDIESVL